LGELPCRFGRNCAESADAQLRLAALDSLRHVAEPQHVASLVRLLADLDERAELRKAQLALLAVCSRGGAECVQAILENLSDPSPPVAIVALHALGRAGGAKALEAVVAYTDHPQPAVADEAVRVLSRWPDREAIGHLLPLLECAKQRYRVLAFRAVVRLAAPSDSLPADMETLTRAATYAQRIEEKRLLLAALSRCAATDALELAARYVDDPSVALEAQLAVLAVAERLSAESRAGVRSVLEKIATAGQSGQLRKRARRLLQAAGDGQ